MSKDDYDCKTCGACCIAPSAEDTGYVALWPGDVKRLAPRERRLLVVDEFEEGGVGGMSQGPALRTRCDRRGNTRCAALRGTIGREVSCAIYPRRPEVCRAFEPGSADCRELRLELMRTGQFAEAKPSRGEKNDR
jgi:Fe-S-cluster containining protein